MPKEAAIFIFQIDFLWLFVHYLSTILANKIDYIVNYFLQKVSFSHPYYDYQLLLHLKFNIQFLSQYI